MSISRRADKMRSAHGKRKTFYVLWIYLLVAAVGCIGYFHDFKAFLIVVAAFSGLAATFVLQKLYESFIRNHLHAGATPSFRALFLIIAVFSIIGTVYFYFTSQNIGTSGFLLGTGLYCLQSFILQPK